MVTRSSTSRFLLFLTYVFSLLTYYFSKDVRLSRPKKFFFRILHIYHFTDFLTYLLLFRRMSGWVDLNFFFVYRLFTTLSDFLTDLLLFLGMSGSVDLNKFFFVSCTFTTLRISLLTNYIFEGCQAESTSNFFFRILLIYHFTGFPYLLTTFSEDVRLS